MNSIFKNMLSRYDIRTRDDYTNALHEVMQETVAEVLPFRQGLRGLINTVCCATLTYGYEKTVFQTPRQSHVSNKSEVVKIGNFACLKDKIFITAGLRPAVVEQTNNFCLKGRTKILII